MSRLPKRWWAALWSSLYEPRSVTALTVAAYALSAIAGMSLWTAAPAADHPTVVVRVAATLLLVGGGAVGAPSAWRGLWWLERTAALAVCCGIVLVGILVFAAHCVTPGPVWLSSWALAMACLYMLTRFLRVRSAPYAPGRGPASSDQQAAALRAVIESETRSRDGR